MTMLLSDGKYEFIYTLFTEGSAKLRLNFMAPCSNDEGKACTQNVSIEKMTQLMAQELTGLSTTKQVESLETQK